jgi:hypothetical protein
MRSDKKECSTRHKSLTVDEKKADLLDGSFCFRFDSLCSPFVSLISHRSTV